MARRLGDRLLTILDVCYLTSLSKTEIYRRIAAGTFPKQRFTGPMSARWSYRAVQRWISSVAEDQPSKPAGTRGAHVGGRA